MKPRIFIVDDEPAMVELATRMLEEERYVVLSDTNPRRALERIAKDPPDLVLLDVSMDELDGLDVCRALKSDAKTRGIPVIFASVKSQEADVVAGLELGAEDYIRKPLSPPELRARIRVALRRQDPTRTAEKITTGPLTIDFSAYKAWLHEERLELTPKQFEVLALFARNEGRVLTRATISEKIWGTDMSGSSRSMNTTIDQVRQKLGVYRHWVQSLKGVGYRFEMDETI